MSTSRILGLLPTLLLLTACTTEQPEPPEGMVYIEAVDHQSAFYIDQYEVSNADFKAFVDATGYQTVAEKAIDWEELRQQVPPGTPRPDSALLEPGALVFTAVDGPVDLRDYSQWWTWTPGASWRQPEGPGSSLQGRMNHPVVLVAWTDARAYADWAGKRLPTVQEWERAAAGSSEVIKEGTFIANIWQGAFPYLNRASDGYASTAPGGSFPPNDKGLYDMQGNVWEWTATTAEPRGSHVMKGGSFLCHDSYCSGYIPQRHMQSSDDSAFNHVGFRCVQDL